MSWNDYVSTSLVGTGSIDHAAIYGIDGLGKWAGSAGFEPDATELSGIAGAYADKSDPKQINSSGFHVAKVKYMTIRADERSIYGAKGKEGIIIVKSKQAIIVAHHPATVTMQSAATVVENLADYLIGVGY